MTRNIIITGVLLILTGFAVFAQKGLSENDLQHLRESFDSNDAHNKAIMNALSANAVTDVAVNRENVGKTGHHFKYKVEVTGITDQESSGRCWMFTSLNSLRPQVIKNKNLSDFHFSENYLYFWDQLEKANLFLENCIATADKPMDDRKVEWLFKNPIGDGGVWNSFANLVDKYGLVPKSAMPESHHSSNTAWMRRILNRKLREQGLHLRELTNSTDKEAVRAEKKVMLADIYRILALSLGEPPREFNYRFVDKDGEIGETRSYTPISFYKKLFPEYSPGDFVMLMNDPTREYYQLYEIEYDRNVMDGRNWKYINLPNEDLKLLAIKGIKANEGMYVSCDVGKQLRKEEGTLDINNYDFESLYGVSFGMDKAERIQTRESGSSHAMLLMAVDVDENENPVKWQFENSWGKSYGKDGYLTFTDAWFDNYLFRLVINKKHVDKKTLKILEEEPVMLPPWDPMFRQD
ncbi:MAG: C1 family peptidase [Bacteroidales bacterium]